MKRKTYWDNLGIHYLDSWNQYQHRKILNQLELNWLDQQIIVKKRLIFFDIGCGPGRIINFLKLRYPTYKTIHAVDHSQEMINICKKTIGEEKISYHVASTDILNYMPTVTADVITAVRVLKYSEERKKFFNYIHKRLSKQGVFLFTITNRSSIACFDQLQIKHVRDTVQEISTLLQQTGFRIIDQRGFQRFPEFFYIFFSTMKLSHVLFKIENILEKYLGKTLLCRTIYFSVQKV